jgi:hypothetical protein
LQELRIYFANGNAFHLIFEYLGGEIIPLLRKKTIKFQKITFKIFKQINCFEKKEKKREKNRTENIKKLMQK